MFTLSLVSVLILVAAAVALGWARSRGTACVLRAHHARRLHFEDARALHHAVARLSLRAGISAPRLYSVRHPHPNAFALGLGRDDQVIVLTEGALEKLEEELIVALLAHEIAHLARGHTPRSTFLALLGVIAGGAVRGLLRWLPFRAVHFRGLLQRQWRATRSRLLAAGTSPSQQLIADRLAVSLLGAPQPLLRLISRLKASPETEPETDLTQAPLGAPGVSGLPRRHQDHQELALRHFMLERTKHRPLRRPRRSRFFRHARG